MQTLGPVPIMTNTLFTWLYDKSKNLLFYIYILQKKISCIIRLGFCLIAMLKLKSDPTFDSFESLDYIVDCFHITLTTINTISFFQKDFYYMNIYIYETLENKILSISNPKGYCMKSNLNYQHISLLL